MTEKKDFPVFRVGIVTLSDKGYQGEREDKSGPKIKELLPAEQYEVVSMRLLPESPADPAQNRYYQKERHKLQGVPRDDHKINIT